jgi:Xaa-Pro dipeptidase
MAVPLNELEDRLAKAQAALASEELDGALIVQTADLYYLTGTAQQAHLLLPAEGEPVLLVRRDLARARRESPLPRVEGLSSLRDLPQIAAGCGIPPDGRLGLELDVLPVLHFFRYQDLFSDARPADCGGMLRELRAVKSPWEVERLREAGRQTEAALSEAAEQLREGMTEAELAALVAAALMRRGHPGLLRMRGLNQEMPIVHVFAGPEAGAASGADVPFAGLGHTAAVPQGAGPRPFRRGEAVVIDLGSSIDGYCVDTTRTLSLGPLPQDLADAHEACRTIRRELLAAALPRAGTRSLYQRAVARAAEMGYESNFMGARPNQVSFVGHGIGLEVDELPVLAANGDRPLVEGNVIAIEPKILLPGRGAVGVEDTYVMTASGLQSLTDLDEGVWEV